MEEKLTIQKNLFGEPIEVEEPTIKDSKWNHGIDKPIQTYQLIIELTNEQEQEELYNKLVKGGYKCRVLIL